MQVAPTVRCQCSRPGASIVKGDNSKCRRGRGAARGRWTSNVDQPPAKPTRFVHSGANERGKASDQPSVVVSLLGLTEPLEGSVEPRDPSPRCRAGITWAQTLSTQGALGHRRAGEPGFLQSPPPQSQGPHREAGGLRWGRREAARWRPWGCEEPSCGRECSPDSAHPGSAHPGSVQPSSARPGSAHALTQQLGCSLRPRGGCRS